MKLHSVVQLQITKITIISIIKMEINIILGVLFYMVATISCQDEVIMPCPSKFEEYKCFSSCAATCSNIYLVEICDKKCNYRCDCIEDYVRNSKGVCVPIFECPKEEIKCPLENQEVVDCLPCVKQTCTATFYKPRKPLICPRICRRGCACKEGYVFDDINGNGCIPKEKCPPKISCCDNQIFNSSGSNCPKTCVPLLVDLSICMKEGTPGCFCQEGYIEDGRGGCVPEGRCPLNCQSGEMENECPNPCQPTCAEPNPYSCLFKACMRGCICVPPLVRDESGRCVDRATCESKCKDINEVYYSCGSGCPRRTCDNLITIAAVQCPAVCVTGCFCKPGYVYDNKRGKCIPEEFCTCPYKL